jgi:hypothetical protein
VRGHGSPEMLEILDQDMKVLATLRMADLRAAWAAQRGTA